VLVRRLMALRIAAHRFGLYRGQAEEELRWAERVGDALVAALATARRKE
jgi:hypothetical protein